MTTHDEQATAAEVRPDHDRSRYEDDPAVSHTFANGVNCYDSDPIIWVSADDCLHAGR